MRVSETIQVERLKQPIVRKRSMFVKLPLSRTTLVGRPNSLVGVFVCVTFVSILFAGDCSVWGQGFSTGGISIGGPPIGGIGKPQFAPLSPPLSPYLDLLRADSGVVSPYHSFVLPQKRITQQQTQQASQIHQLRSRVQTLNAGHQGSGQPRRSRTRTGSGGYFQQYSHFYSAPNLPARH